MISVIIPVYNVENYLVKCLDSVINQTYNELEIILIDDGSEDSSGNICDEYAINDSRIKVIHKKNEGQAVARNFGLDIASGDFISFIDSDDWLELNMLEIMLKTVMHSNSEIVQCGIKNIYLDKIVVSNNKSENYSSIQALEDMLSEKTIRFEIWNKLYKKECIENIRFKNGQIHEEIYFTSRVILNANRITSIEAPLYNYLLDRPGNTNSYFKASKLVAFEEFNSLINLFTNNGNLKLAQLTKVLAIKYCMTFYLIAYRNNSESNIKEKLLDYFNYYLKNIDKSYLKDSLKIKLFKLNPNFYSKLYPVIIKFK